LSIKKKSSKPGSHARVFYSLIFVSFSQDYCLIISLFSGLGPVGMLFGGLFENFYLDLGSHSGTISMWGLIFKAIKRSLDILKKYGIIKEKLKEVTGHGKEVV
jgi:hypothetical protein